MDFTFIDFSVVSNLLWALLSHAFSFATSAFRDLLLGSVGFIPDIFVASPLDQFIVKPLFVVKVAQFDLSFTNASLFMVLVVGLASLAFFLCSRERERIPGKLQSVIELAYLFVRKTLFAGATEKAEGMIPFMFTLFFFILFSNMMGMLPYSYTTTSQFITTLGLALILFSTIFILGFIKQGVHFLQIFAPKGIPFFLVPFIAILEFFTYLSRPFSLAIRLAANMTAGHIMMKVIANMVVLTVAKDVFYITPFAITFIVALISFEFFVSFSQAYIFMVLSSVYIRDVFEGH